MWCREGQTLGELCPPIPNALPPSCQNKIANCLIWHVSLGNTFYRYTCSPWCSAIEAKFSIFTVACLRCARLAGSSCGYNCTKCRLIKKSNIEFRINKGKHSLAKCKKTNHWESFLKCPREQKTLLKTPSPQGLRVKTNNNHTRI